jgi:hypothetical protein
VCAMRNVPYWIQNVFTFVYQTIMYEQHCQTFIEHATENQVLFDLDMQFRQAAALVTSFRHFFRGC